MQLDGTNDTIYHRSKKLQLIHYKKVCYEHEIPLAINTQEHPAAITLLEEALNQSLTDSQLHYLLGAEYAQIGEYENAIGTMTQAITLNPELYTAIFRLGLLYQTLGQPDQATQTWAPLADLPENNSLRLFSLGLQHLAKDEFTQCQALLEEGMKNNHSDPALNADMQKVLENIAVIG